MEYDIFGKMYFLGQKKRRPEYKHLDRWLKKED
jgi:hypothetical protein